MTTVLSYGGGLDSFGMLVDSIIRGELPDVCVFCDVADSDGKDPGEWPATYKHIREVVIPLCKTVGVPFEWLDTKRYPVRDAPSLFRWMYDRVQIPVAGPDRICTTVAKVERFERWVTDTYGDRPVEVWIGFDANEGDRAAFDPNAGASKKKLTACNRINRYPLIERQLCRCRLDALIRKAGLPVPNKSACVFCPYNRLGDWQQLARDLPHQFAQIVDMEARKMAKPTEDKNRILSIFGWSSEACRKAEARGEQYSPRPLPVVIRGRPGKPQTKPCTVCGAAEQIRKVVGCEYSTALEEAA